ncbi:hypothetical protein C8J57DRAFT_1318766 [Mycena rebaudengoi]|nr:hypothetical protein C8J57DRAFT_1318766 [Mycena rebaudengoi]
MPTKGVHWKLTTEEYEADPRSPDSWTSPLPEPQIPVVPLELRRPARSSPTLQLHSVLTPQNCLQLDFSFPSDSFRSNPQLTKELLAQPACSPPRTEVFITIRAGLLSEKLQLAHEVRGQPVTVGHVLTRINSYLRQHDPSPSPDTLPYQKRRISTVNGYCEGRSPAAKTANIAAEGNKKGRKVDSLLGRTLFAGLSGRLGKPDNDWQLDLTTPLRYSPG